MKDAAEFLAKNQGRRPGPKCTTCSLPNLDEVNQAVLKFNKARQRGHRMSWRCFLQEYLEPELNYPLRVRALKDHLQNCLGQEVS